MANCPFFSKESQKGQMATLIVTIVMGKWFKIAMKQKKN
jgi:hypothetical protein